MDFRWKRLGSGQGKSTSAKNAMEAFEYMLIPPYVIGHNQHMGDVVVDIAS